MGSMIRMDRNEMHVNSMSIVQQMRLFMEIAYYLAAHPETRNKSGIARSKMPSTLVRESRKKNNSMEAHIDVARINDSPVPEGGLASLSQPTHGTTTEGFEPATQGANCSLELDKPHLSNHFCTLPVWVCCVLCHPSQTGTHFPKSPKARHSQTTPR